ncbi:hypothetical protein N7G274_005456 [Stereocaulon virgatum]|uniref:Uncharacterized protein n=1 Tax=Stereocaulon virgatum TaxID=373712 RepID=A0ABR4AB09_9LECA
MPALGDQSVGQIKKSMQPIILESFPGTAPPQGLDREQKLAFVAYDIEQHEQAMKDKIRAHGLCEKEQADSELVANAFVQPSWQEPGPKALHAGIRSAWKRHGPKPVVKSSRRSQPTFHLQPKNDHVGVAKRAVARLDNYKQHLQSTATTSYQTMDGLDHGGSGNSSTPVVSSSVGSRISGPAGSYDASRDPRLKR